MSIFMLNETFHSFSFSRGHCRVVIVAESCSIIDSWSISLVVQISDLSVIFLPVVFSQIEFICIMIWGPFKVDPLHEFLSWILSLQCNDLQLDNLLLIDSASSFQSSMWCHWIHGACWCSCSRWGGRLSSSIVSGCWPSCPCSSCLDCGHEEKSDCELFSKHFVDLFYSSNCFILLNFETQPLQFKLN